MTELFKDCGQVSISELMPLLKPTIELMKKEGLTQYGFTGRVLTDGEIDYGEGKTRSRAKLSDWHHWRPGFEDRQLLSFLKEYSNYQIGRIRLMKIPPRTCYSWHRDLTPRLHIPLITNSTAFMIVKEQSKHLTYGKLWWVDTTRYHTAMNCAEVDRWHLIYEVAADPLPQALE